MDLIEQQNIYLCMNVASLLKDRIEAEKQAHKKMENEMKKHQR